MNTLEHNRFLHEIVYEAFAGGIILLARFFSREAARNPPGRREAASDGRHGRLGGEGEGRCSSDFGGEVSGSGFAASVFDIWAMRDDGPPKMSSAKNDFASRNEVI